MQEHDIQTCPVCVAFCMSLVDHTVLDGIGDKWLKHMVSLGLIRDWRRWLKEHPVERTGRFKD